MSRSRPTLAGFVLFWESIDIQAVLEQCRRRNPDILFASTASHHLFRFLHKPAGFQNLRNQNHWIQFEKTFWFYLTYPLRLIADQCQIVALLLRLLARSRRPIPVALANHLYHLPSFLFFRKLGLIRQLIYVSGDWLANQPGPRLFWSGIGSRLVFPWMDRLACSGSDRVLQITKISQKAREKYWGKKITGSEEFFFPPIKKLFKGMAPASKRKKILYLGGVRPDSGLENFLPLLGRLHERYGIRLQLAGPLDSQTTALASLAEKMGMKKALLFHGPFKRADLLKITQECFCGLNLSTQKDNFSRYTIPAKSLDYLQYGLPIIANAHIGDMARWIRQADLGVVIPLKSEAFQDAVLRLLKYQKRYRKNITDFLENYRGTDFGKFFPAPAV